VDGMEETVGLKDVIWTEDLRKKNGGRGRG